MKFLFIVLKYPINMLSLENYALYAGFILLLYTSFTKEVDDLFSDKIDKNSNSTNFGDGYGKFIYPNKYSEKDGKDEKLRKLSNLTDYEQSLPKWRRCLLVAAFITIILSIIVHRKILPFPDFFKYVIIIFFETYFSFNYYSYHYNNHAVNYMKEYIDKFKESKD